MKLERGNIPQQKKDNALVIGGIYLTERQLQDNIIDAARKLRWIVAFFRPARVLRKGKEIYETPVGADGAGFPDLVLVRERDIFFVELKSEKGKLRKNQEEWLKALDRNPTVRCFVWRPSDWLDDSILKILR